MGIRPSLYLLCGIDDLKVEDYEIVDPRWQPNPKYEDDGGFRNASFDLTELRAEMGRRREMLSANIAAREKGDTAPFEKAMRRGDAMNAAFIYHSLCNEKMVGDERKYEPKPIYDVIQWDAEYGSSNVIGYTIDASKYAPDWLYALGLLYPEFQQQGWRRLPSVPLEEDCSGDAMLLRALIRYKEVHGSIPFGKRREAMKGYGLREKKRKICNEQNVGVFTMYMDGYLTLAQWALNEIGLKVDRNDLRLMLYWRWS